MKINYCTLEKIYLDRNGNLSNGKAIFVEKVACKECGEPYLMLIKQPTLYCSLVCSRLNMSDITKKKMSEKRRFRTHSLETRKRISKANKGRKRNPSTIMYGKAHPCWKGGVSKDNLPLFDTYSSKISFADEVRLFIDEANRRLLEVRCSTCGKWFLPTQSAVRCRVASLNGKRQGESRLYCSKQCKEDCNVYNRQAQAWAKRPIIENNVYTKHELSIWSKEVLKRANYLCEYCGKPAEHAHHIEPKKLEPGLALDPTNGLACCVECHYKYGHRDECSTWNLSQRRCR